MSAGQGAGIPEIMWRAQALFALLWSATISCLASGGCDMQSLRSSQLFGGRDAAVDGTAGDGAVERAVDAAADVWEVMSPDAIDAIVTADAPDTADTSDAASTADAVPDLAAMGMLSGSVVDTCTRSGLDALVGIAGRHTCSYPQKGSYFFRAVPLGTLKLAAAKEGYALFEATIEIVPGGNIHNIDMVPAGDGGCAALPSPPVACACTTPTCEP